MRPARRCRGTAPDRVLENDIVRATWRRRQDVCGRLAPGVSAVPDLAAPVAVDGRIRVRFDADMLHTDQADQGRPSRRVRRVADVRTFLSLDWRKGRSAYYSKRSFTNAYASKTAQAAPAQINVARNATSRPSSCSRTETRSPPVMAPNGIEPHPKKR